MYPWLISHPKYRTKDETLSIEAKRDDTSDYNYGDLNFYMQLAQSTRLRIYPVQTEETILHHLV